MALSQHVFEITRDLKFFFNREFQGDLYEIGHIGQSAGQIGQIGHFLNEEKKISQKVEK